MPRCRHLLWREWYLFFQLFIRLKIRIKWFQFLFTEVTNWSENIKETYLEFTTTASLALPLRVLNELVMCIISLIESFMLLKQMGKRWAWAKKAMVSFISPKPDDEKRILRTNFQSATKFMWTYSRRLPITRTFANANLALTRTKTEFPWISFIHLL